MEQDGNESDRTRRKKPSVPTWAKVILLGCCSLALALSCCIGAPILFVLNRAVALQQAAEAEMTHVPPDCLRGGDLDAVYQFSSASFSAKYTLAEWQRFVAQHPQLRDPQALDAATAATRTFNGNVYRLVRLQLPGGGTLDMIFHLVEGALRLLGVRPQLEAALPSGLLETFDKPAAPRPRRHRFFHD